MRLLFMGYRLGGGERVEVVQDGVPVPFEWIGPCEVEVDDVFQRAAIRVTKGKGNGDEEATGGSRVS